MIEIIFFARGGQGAVTASQILATAAFQEGKYAQAFPSFGVERRGAPVTAYARIDTQPIVKRNPIAKADYVVALDPSALKTSNPLDRLKERGCAILNAEQYPENLCGEMLEDDINVFCINASSISEQVYGPRPIPMTNLAMLGALAAVSPIVQLETILDVVDQYFSGEAAERARRTARMAYEKANVTLE